MRSTPKAKPERAFVRLTESEADTLARQLKRSKLRVRQYMRTVKFANTFVDVYCVAAWSPAIVGKKESI